MAGKKKIEWITRRQVRYLADRGWREEDIADFCQCALGTIRKKYRGVLPKGRPPQPPIDLSVVENLAAIGATDEEIARLLGMSVTKFSPMKKEVPELAEALEKGKANGKLSLRRKMFKTAMVGNIFQMQMFLAKNLLGYSDNQRVEHSGEIGVKEKVVPTPDPDMTPEKWAAMHQIDRGGESASDQT
jgi:hypothetical protein